MNNRLFKLLTLVPLLLCAELSQAANYYVSPTGTSNPSCNLAQPCREIRQALTLVSAGDTVLVANGEYKGFTARNLSGTSSQPITIKAQGNDAVVMATIDRPPLENRDNIFITFSDYFVVDGLKTFNAPRSGMRVDTSHNVVVRNCVMGDNGTWGIFTNHSNSILLERNATFGSADEHGIYFSNSADNPTIRNNRIFGNAANGIHMNADLSAGGASGVVGDGVITGARVEANIIYDNGRSGGGGINMDGVQNSVIANNVLYENHASGIIGYRIDAAQGPRNLTIAHNTLDMASDARYAVQVSQTTGPIVIRNNILGTRSSRRGGLAYGNVSDVPNVSSSHNIFVGNPVIAFNDWSILKTLGQWQGESASNEASSFISSNAALFVNASASVLANRDYHLKSTAPAINAAASVAGVARDLDGGLRPVGVAADIGADESGSSGGGTPNPNPGSGKLTVGALLNLLLDDELPD